jgi:hypothetical protein
MGFREPWECVLMKADPGSTSEEQESALSSITTYVHILSHNHLPTESYICNP